MARQAVVIVAADMTAIIREERIGGQRLILGDCLAVMEELGQFDAVVTDPPYGIGRDGKPPSTSSHGGHKGYAFKDWDKSAPPAEVFRSIFAISGEQIIWGANFFPQYLRPAMGWLFWDKGQRISQSDGELAFTSRENALRVFTLNRAALARDGAVHPTQKPLALMEWCLGFLPNARTILDPFAGSGTTAVACERMGRQCTAIEIDPDYFDIACRRVEEATRQPDMFVTAPEQPKQEALL